eukprot:gene26203-11934_t
MPVLPTTLRPQYDASPSLPVLPTRSKFERPPLWTGDVTDKRLPRGQMWWHSLDVYARLHQMQHPDHLTNSVGAAAHAARVRKRPGGQDRSRGSGGSGGDPKRQREEPGSLEYLLRLCHQKKWTQQGNLGPWTLDAVTRAQALKICLKCGATRTPGSNGKDKFSDV